MGDEMYISRMYRPDLIAEMVQSNLHEHHHEEPKTEKDMHIYLDGVQKNFVTVPYKSGFRYVPSVDDDTKFLEKIKQQPGVIDLSG